MQSTYLKHSLVLGIVVSNRSIILLILVTAIFTWSKSSEKSSSLVVISVLFGCNAWHFCMICSWVSSSCWHIYGSCGLGHVSKVVLYFQHSCSCLEQSAGLEVSHCIHVLWVFVAVSMSLLLVAGISPCTYSSHLLVNQKVILIHTGVTFYFVANATQ